MKELEDEKTLCKRAAFAEAMEDKRISDLCMDESMSRTAGCPVWKCDTAVLHDYDLVLAERDNRLDVYEMSKDQMLSRLVDAYMYDDYSFNPKYGSVILQKTYEEVASREENEFLIDGEVSFSQAEDWIADEFGFEYTRIEVLGYINLYCKNVKTGKLVKCGCLERLPYASSETNNYIRFYIMGVTDDSRRNYECINGKLFPMEG